MGSVTLLELRMCGEKRKWRGAQSEGLGPPGAVGAGVWIPKNFGSQWESSMTGGRAGTVGMRGAVGAGRTPRLARQGCAA